MDLEWKIIYIANGYQCQICGKTEYPYIDHICDAHTVGLMETFGHPELQLIIDYGPNEIMRILNTIGIRIKNGERFKEGDMIKGIYEDCELRLDCIDDGYGIEPYLRVIIPDRNNLFPEEPGCNTLHSLQRYGLSQLERKTQHKH